MVEIIDLESYIKRVENTEMVHRRKRPVIFCKVFKCTSTSFVRFSIDMILLCMKLLRAWTFNNIYIHIITFAFPLEAGNYDLFEKWYVFFALQKTRRLEFELLRVKKCEHVFIKIIKQCTQTLMSTTVVSDQTINLLKFNSALLEARHWFTFVLLHSNQQRFSEPLEVFPEIAISYIDLLRFVFVLMSVVKQISCWRHETM